MTKSSLCKLCRLLCRWQQLASTFWSEERSDERRKVLAAASATAHAAYASWYSIGVMLLNLIWYRPVL